MTLASDLSVTWQSGTLAVCTSVGRGYKIRLAHSFTAFSNYAKEEEEEEVCLAL